jgi:DNA polymerase III alpha subunit
VLGFLISRHPLTLFENELRGISYVEAKDLARYVGRRVRTVGWWVTGKIVKTKTDEPMEFVSFEDTTAIYETTFFPRTYSRFCHMLSRTRPYLLSGRVEENFGAITLTVDDVAFLDRPLPRRWRAGGRTGTRAKESTFGS